MRQLALIASLVALVMYAGFVSRAGTPVGADSANASLGARLGPLQHALTAAQAPLDQVLIAAWVEIKGVHTRESVEAALGWGRPAVTGEVRKLNAMNQNGGQYLVLRWELSGPAVGEWQAKAEAAARVLESVGPAPLITVQLSGVAPVDRPETAVEHAMNALGSTGRQPWSGGASFSMAGQSPVLPRSAPGVNVQVAARRDPSGRSSRIWIAWPTLLQEY